MLDSLFGRRKKKPPASSSLGETIKDAGVGDVFTVTGLSLDYEESYFIVAKKNRYESFSGRSYELLGVDGDHRLWVHWSDEGGLFVSAMAERKPTGLEGVGLTEDDLVRMDDQHSIDNSVTHEGVQFHYKNSGEAFLYQDNGPDGEGFYLWEFAGDDKMLSIDKYEGMPFQGFVSDVVPPDSVTVYKR